MNIHNNNNNNENNNNNNVNINNSINGKNMHSDQYYLSSIDGEIKQQVSYNDDSPKNCTENHFITGDYYPESLSEIKKNIFEEIILCIKVS